MKTIKFFIIALLLLNIGDAAAQYMSSPKLSGVGVPFFTTSIFRTFTDDGQSRLVRIYIQLMNDDLTFIKADDHYVAKVQYEIYINDQEKESVYSANQTKEIIAESFEETNSRKKLHTFTIDIPLEAGDYDAVIMVVDKTNNKQVNRKISFKVQSMEGLDFLLSDILIFSKFKTDSSGRIVSFEPALTNNFGGNNKYIYFYFTSIVQDPLDTLNIAYTIRDASKSINQFNQYNIVRKAGYYEHYIRINREMFDQNRYEIELIGHYHGNSIKTRKIFSFFWTTTPESPQDLDTALRQMRYILEADSVGWALKQDYETKLAYFKRFWKRMDPNPDTQKNELMDEYYRRINYANENFSSLSNEGWETDRGRIFVKFGEPDDIERHPFEIDTYPYEVWRYYDMRKVFVFIDRTGFGDYYLHPDYLDEEFN